MRHRCLLALIFAAAVVAPSLTAQGPPPPQPPPQQQQPPPQQQQPPPEQQRPPVFRGGTNLVQVDAYPTRDGKILEGLTAEDFEVFEDGKPQKIEDLQFIRVDVNTPIAERLDPTSQAEANRLAADPRNRVFVVYLDHYHVDVTGSFRTQRPLVNMLDRLLTPQDLFGVMTPLLRPADLILGRRTETLEQQLARHWTWGEKPSGGTSMFLEPHEAELVACFGKAIGEELARRSRQDRVMQGLKALARHLGTLREARKVLLLFTGGWRMYQAGAPDFTGASKPGVGTSLGGTLTTTPPPGYANMSRCTSEAIRLYGIDTQTEFRDLLDVANRNNVSFYPVNAMGLEAPDLTGSSGSLTSAWDDIRDRWQLLLTLAENTDGIAVGTNDMAADLRRIADDVSAYYVLSYYPANTKMDGRYRRIEVKVKAPDATVKARRGYVAPSPASDSARPAASPAGAPPEVEEALGALTRLRPAAELFSHAVAMPQSLAVVVELPADRALTGRWASGADVQVTVADAAGAAIGAAKGRIDAPSRGALLHVALPEGSRGPWTVSTRVGDGAGAVADRLEVAPRRGTLAGDGLVSRARPSPRAPLQPAADHQFRRTERLHVDWPRFGDLDRREARVLGRNGAPLAIPVTVTDREVDGQSMLSVDINLAPLTEADYLVELVVGRGEIVERKLIAFRLLR